VHQLRQRCCVPIVTEGPPRRGFAGQRSAREQEQETRHHAVSVGAGLVANGWTWATIADWLHLPQRTLRHWREQLARDGLAARALGRPVLPKPREQRNEVIHFLDEYGPAVGLPMLRICFPSWTRSGLEDLLRRYRRVWRARRRQPLCVLHWTAPGRVWAIDFNGPLPAIDGLYPHLLAVRELASGRQLLWLPLREATAAQAVEALASLFIIHGAPLVLKSDNGKAFGAAEVQQLLQEFGVENLFSPPYMPSYNGAIEAGIGSLKSRTEAQAARQDRPGHWTWDDAAAARLEANATARPRGPLGPSPDELWAGRTPIGAAERQTFRATAASLRAAQTAAHGGPTDTPEDVMSQRATDRDILRQALEAHNYLHYTRRRIPRPIRRQKVASIT
jgi:transposase InsO family protein